MQCLKDMLRQPLSLFRGMSFPLAATPFMNAVVFWSYTGSLVRLQPTQGDESGRPVSMWTVAAAGAAAGERSCSLFLLVCVACVVCVVCVVIMCCVL